MLIIRNKMNSNGYFANTSALSCVLFFLLFLGVYIDAKSQNYSYCYGNGENFVWTFCPENPGSGEKMVFAFISGQMEGYYEHFKVYDGNSVESPLIEDWSSGDASGRIWAASNPQGCLTIQFSADVSVSCSSGNYIPWQYSVFPASNCDHSNSSVAITSVELNSSNLCKDWQLNAVVSPVIQKVASGWNYQWKLNGQVILGATQSTYVTEPQTQNGVYTCELYCQTTDGTIISNTIEKSACSNLDYMLIQNVTMASVNSSQGTAQVQFDLNWGNSWKDSINWDAAWVFIKYKNAAGEWKHAKINPTGYDHGIGTNNIIEPTADKMGAFIRMADFGQTNFTADGLQLQWNYGLDGVSNPSNLEIKVFATEMVYMPQGDFNVIANSPNWDSNYAQNIKAPGNNAAVINTRMTPILTAGNSTQFRVKGDAGLDSNADGVIDAPNYPTGYTPFYAFKYEMTEQQYADFLNCLTTDQQNALGVAGSSISMNNGVYYASAPNRVCYGYSNERFLAYSDWAGLRPMSVLEFSKAVFGPYANHQDFSDRGTGDYDVGRSGLNQGTGYYGMKDAYAYSAGEPMVTIASNQFTKFLHGDGVINPNGLHNQSGWDSIDIIHGNGPVTNTWGWGQTGFRFVRTAE